MHTDPERMVRTVHNDHPQRLIMSQHEETQVPFLLQDPKQFIEEVKACLYHHWLLRYSLKGAVAGAADAHFSGYLNLM